MQPEARKYLHDALTTAALVTQFTAGKSFADYEDSDLLRSAVERQFEIVGEALNRLARVDPETAAKVGDYRRIVAFRNLIAHGYDAVDSRLVWGIVEGRLGSLLEDLRALLSP